MRYHITLTDSAMTAIRNLAVRAGCAGVTDRETLQAYIHHLAGEEMPKHGGARPGSGPKPKGKPAKKKRRG